MIKKAFTLVELIVVVTILAILGIIAFISIQGFTIDARDSKRVSDARSLITKITVENTKGIDYSELINPNGKTGTFLKINQVENRPGEQNIANGLNFELLKENIENFRDPLNDHPYPFAYAEGNAGGIGYSFIQLAYVEEKTGTTKLVGNYYEMQPGDSPSLFVNENGDGTNISNDYIKENGEPIYDIGTPNTGTSTNSSLLDGTEVTYDEFDYNHNGTDYHFNEGQVVVGDGTKTIISDDEDIPNGKKHLDIDIETDNNGNVTKSNPREVIECDNGYDLNGTTCIPKSGSNNNFVYQYNDGNGNVSYEFGEVNLTYPNTTTKTGTGQIENGSKTITLELGVNSNGDIYVITNPGSIVVTISCNAGYQISGSSCVPKTKTITSVTYNSRTYAFSSFTLIYGTSQTKTSSSLTITGGTSTLTATFTLGTDGTTITLSGQSESISCNGGYYLANNTTCKEVDNGYYSPEGSNTQIQCPLGYSCTTSTTTQCSAGKYSVAGSTSCSICPAGTYSSAGAGSCSTCLVNTYSGNGAVSCNTCPTNSTTNNLTGRTTISECLGKAGYRNCQSGECSPAGTGYFSATNSNDRTKCPDSGTTSTTTASVNTECKKTITCTGLPATGAVWNTVSSITKNYDGSSYNLPSASATYSTTASTTVCRYKCNTGYSRVNSSCQQNSCASYTSGNGTFKPGTPTSPNTAWQTTNSSNPCYVSCSSGYTWNSSSGSCKDKPGVSYSGNDIIITDLNGDKYVIMDKNLGATEVYNGTEKSSVRGNYYQWGRSDTTFTTGGINWCTGNSWGGINDSTIDTDSSTKEGARKGPCPTGRHIPSTGEWRILIKTWFTIKGQNCTLNASFAYSCNWVGNATLANFQAELKLPKAGKKDTDGSMAGQTYYGEYWSSSPYTTNQGFNISFFDTEISDPVLYPGMHSSFSYGYPIRCFKN